MTAQGDTSAFEIEGREFVAEAVHRLEVGERVTVSPDRPPDA